METFTGHFPLVRLGKSNLTEWLAVAMFSTSPLLYMCLQCQLLTLGTVGSMLDLGSSLSALRHKTCIRIILVGTIKGTCDRFRQGSGRICYIVFSRSQKLVSFACSSLQQGAGLLIHLHVSKTSGQIIVEASFKDLNAFDP